MKIVFFGTPQFAVPTLESLIKHPDFEVTAVVTQPDKIRGRGNKTSPSAIKKIALEYNIPVWQPKRIKKHRETLDNLQKLNADAFVVVAYGQILSSEILNMPKLGCINVHGSILPKYRGAAPIQWSIYDGDRQTGITTMLMDVGMDTGDMLLKSETPIHILDNALDIAIKLSQEGADLLIETLIKLAAKEIIPIPQNDNEATYARLINKSDYKIDWTQKAIDIHHRIRAFYPNCVTNFRDKSLKVTETIPLIENYLIELGNEFENLRNKLSEIDREKGEPGEIISILKNWGCIVQTGSGLLLLKQVQPSGKRSQSGWDFVNGMRIEIGEKF